MEDILVGQVEEVRWNSNWDDLDLRISSRWYMVNGGDLSTGSVSLRDSNVLLPLENFVASDDFTELVPVD